MIDWQPIKDLIRDQISTLAKLDPKYVRWVDEPSGDLFGAEPVVYLRVSSIVSVGNDENRFEDSPNGEASIVNVTGQRDFTLSIRCESFTQDITDPRFAGNVIEALKTRLFRFSAVDARFGVFTIRNYLATKFFTYEDADREINAYIADFLCGAVENDIDTTLGAGDFIGEAIISGEIKETDNTVLGTINLDITKP